MIKYTVKRNGVIISEYTSDFADETYYEENWGKPEHTIELTPLQTIYHEAIPAVLDEEGEELEPAVEAYTEVIEATFEVVPSEYLVEIEDITEQVNLEAINQEAQAYLAETDYKVLRHIRQKALEQPTTLSEEEYLELEEMRDAASKRIL